jgi:F-type H+-transporting ATPase subunit b
MSVRRAAAAVAFACCPAAAMAQSNMPQMDFSNPLTTSQVVWMVIIMVALYLVLSRWGLPEIGKVLEHRAKTIETDLETARAAKAEADKAVANLNRTMKQARDAAQAEIAKAVTEAKAKALAEAQALKARLDAQLDESEAQIKRAREAALDAIRPVAAAAATEILQRLTGRAPDAAALTPQIDTAFAASQAA